MHRRITVLLLLVLGVCLGSDCQGNLPAELGVPGAGTVQNWIPDGTYAGDITYRFTYRENGVVTLDNTDMMQWTAFFKDGYLLRMDGVPVSVGTEVAVDMGSARFVKTVTSVLRTADSCTIYGDYVSTGPTPDNPMLGTYTEVYRIAGPDSVELREQIQAASLLPVSPLIGLTYLYEGILTR